MHRRILPLLAGLALLGATSPARAHAPPPIYISVAVGEEEMSWELTVSKGIFEDWLPLQADALEGLEGAALAEAGDEIEAFIAEWGGVRIDGVPVKGVLQSVRSESFLDHDLDWAYVLIRMGYAAKGMPRQVSLVWRNFNGGLGGYFDSVETEIEGLGETSYFVFRESEPEVVWHAPRAERMRAPPTLPRVEPPPHLTIPLISVGLLLLTILVLLVLRLRRARRPVLLAVTVTGLALVLGLSEVARTDVVLPGGTRVESPGETEAAEIFEALLRNIYRAFDHGDSEDDVYDTLALTVTGDLLDDLYLEIHASLVLQEAGGAVSKVQKVEIAEVTVLPPEEGQGSWFKVRARWRVQGKVGHWGHTHVRLNEYIARFTVTQADGGWKIADMEVLAQERLDDGSLGGR